MEWSINKHTKSLSWTARPMSSLRWTQSLPWSQYLPVHPLPRSQYLPVHPLPWPQYLPVHPLPWPQYFPVHPLPWSQYLPVHPLPWKQYLPVHPLPWSQYSPVHPIPWSQYLPVHPLRQRHLYWSGRFFLGLQRPRLHLWSSQTFTADFFSSASGLLSAVLALPSRAGGCTCIFSHVAMIGNNGH